KLTTAESSGSRMSRKLQKLRVHHVAAETDVPSLGELSALNLDWDFLTGLRDAGRSAAERWLREAANDTIG
ncbi:MAG TPA: patatin-like phospholipase family protein, partial [Hyphomicrobiaceae bacterium]